MSRDSRSRYPDKFNLGESSLSENTLLVKSTTSFIDGVDSKENTAHNTKKNKELHNKFPEIPSKITLNRKKDYAQADDYYQRALEAAPSDTTINAAYADFLQGTQSDLNCYELISSKLQLSILILSPNAQ